MVSCGSCQLLTQCASSQSSKANCKIKHSKSHGRDGPISRGDSIALAYALQLWARVCVEDRLVIDGQFLPWDVPPSLPLMAELHLNCGHVNARWTPAEYAPVERTIAAAIACDGAGELRDLRI